MAVCAPAARAGNADRARCGLLGHLLPKLCDLAEATEALAKMADRDETVRALMIKSIDGNAKRNPLVKIAADAGADMLRYASEFGLTPIARTRLAAGGFKPPSIEVRWPDRQRHRAADEAR